MISFNLCINGSYRISFKSDDIKGLESNLELMIKNYIPGGEIDLTGGKVDFEVIYKKSTKRKLLEKESGLVIYDDWGDKISLDLWHLLYSIVRLNYLAVGQYPVHAACLGLDKNILLMGHSGVGKTTIMLRLANDLGMKILSGNKTVVNISDDGLSAVAATTAVSLRAADLKKYPNLEGRVTRFSDRAALFLEKEKYLSTDRAKLSTIFMVKINDNWEETESLGAPENLHMLYPYFMDTVYADTILCGGNEVYSGAVKKEVSVKLARSLSKNLNKVKLIRVTGSIKYIISEIKKWL